MKEINRRFKILYGMLGFANAADFAAELGIHRAYLNQIYTNGINPSFEKTLISKFPRINIEYLKTGEGDPVLPEMNFNADDIQRAGKVQMVVDLLSKLDPENLKIIMDGVEKFRETSHFIRFSETETEKPKPKKK